MSKTVVVCHDLKALRRRPAWMLLAADNAPQIISILQDLYGGSEKSIETGVLHERVHKQLEVLRDYGEDLPASVKDYVSDWLNKGWLNRKLRAGGTEDVYELTAEAEAAMRISSGMIRPRTAATESRLSVVISQMKKLAEDTDANQARRLEGLITERNRLDAEISEVMKGNIKTLPSDRARERLRDIIAMSTDISGDFRRYSEELTQIDHRMRRNLIEGDKSTSEVLQSFFGNMDLLGTTEEGKTFAAFWGLLIDQSQSLALEDSIFEILKRDFTNELDAGDRKYLQKFTNQLFTGASSVQETNRALSRSLRAFVQSGEYKDQKRIRDLIEKANKIALQIKDKIRPHQDTGFELTLTQMDVQSVSQVILHTPTDEMPKSAMEVAAQSDISMDVVTQQIMNSEIDMETLRKNVHKSLERNDIVSVADLLRDFPVNQGLGTVLGYLHLAISNGRQPLKNLDGTSKKEKVSWVDKSGNQRSAQIDQVCFEREHSETM
jgi:hypothetical protein